MDAMKLDNVSSRNGKIISNASEMTILVVAVFLFVLFLSREIRVELLSILPIATLYFSISTRIWMFSKGYMKFNVFCNPISYLVLVITPTHEVRDLSAKRQEMLKL